MRNIARKALQVTWANELHQSAGDEDEFIIDYFSRKKGGYLLDIACACPVSGSLSYKLLNRYDWYGILVEPSSFHKENIEACYGDVDGVHFFAGAIHQTKDSIELFEPLDTPSIGFSTLDKHFFEKNRINKYNSYSVPCISIMNLLKKYDAPKDIDFMNLDIEESELQVLDNLDFSEYNIKLICIENGIIYEDIMKSNGYRVCDSKNYKLVHQNLFYEKV